MKPFPKIVFWTAIVVTLAAALMPLPPRLPGAPSDKVQHMIAFATLAALARWAYREAPLVRLLAGLSAFGALIEILQGIPALNRDPEFADWIADTLAAATLLLLASLVARPRAAIMRGGTSKEIDA